MKKLIFRCLLICFTILSYSPTFGADLGISPPDINLNLNRGEEYRGEIYLFGSDTEEIEVNGYINDWALAIDGGYQFLPMGTLKRSASPWINLTTRHLKLPPKRGQKIFYNVKVPYDANGSYWSVLMFATKPAAAPKKEQFQIAMAARVAYIIRINVNGSPAGVEDIERFRLNWNPAKKKIEASLRIKNNGLSFLRFKGRLDLKDKQGKKVGSILFQEGLILPGYTREFSLTDYNLQLPPGFYIGLAVADFGGRSLKAVQATVQIK